MRRVYKGPEPPSLKTFREQDPAPSWDGYQQKDDAYRTATTEQRQLCAFCQTSIQYKARPIKMAHIVPQKSEPDGQRLQLIWSNLVGSCPGGQETGRPRIMHCDARQGNTSLSATLNPVQFINGSLTYDWDGHIKPAKDDDKLLKELNDVLGLNCGPVVKGRQLWLEEMKKQLAAAPDREAWRQDLLVQLDPDRSSTAPLKPYADYLLFHLREGELMSIGTPAPGADSSEVSPGTPAQESS